MGATTKRYVPSPAAETLLAVAILIGLYRASVYSYPLFHVVAELFSIVVAGADFYGLLELSPVLGERVLSVPGHRLSLRRSLRSLARPCVQGDEPTP